MHIHSGDLAVFIGGVVINAFVGIAAAGVQGNLVLTVVQLAAAALLLYRAENMEKVVSLFSSCRTYYMSTTSLSSFLG